MSYLPDWVVKLFVAVGALLVLDFLWPYVRRVLRAVYEAVKEDLK